MPTALIIDDEPQANTLLAMLVQLRGYRTVSALNGQEAIDALERESFDIVFLDLMLPDINGYEVCTHIKSSKATTLTPVVMVTARMAVENRVRSFLHGADNYVAKPFTPNQIYDAIAQADEVRRGAEHACRRGSVALDADDEGESLRRLAQLRSLLLAGTPLPSEEIARLGESLRLLWESADAWGRRHRVGPVAVLDYHVHDDHVEVRLHDRSGWLSDALSHSDGCGDRPDEVANSSFDRVEIDGPLRTMVLVKRFRTGNPRD